MSRRKQTNPQTTKQTNMSDETEKEDQFNDNQNKESIDNLEESQINSNQLNELKKKRTKRSSQSPVKETTELNEEDEQLDNQLIDKLDKNQLNNKSKRNKKSNKNMLNENEEQNKSEDQLIDNKNDNQYDNKNLDKKDDDDQLIEQQTNDNDENKKNQDAMRALFSRLQGIDSEPADLLTACSKKKKKVKTDNRSPRSANSRSPLNIEQNQQQSHDNEEENNKNNVNNKRKDNTDELLSEDDMQCDDDTSLNQSWSSTNSKKQTRLTNKLTNDSLNGLLSQDTLVSSNKKRKLNQQQLKSNSNNNKSSDLSASDMLAKYQSQFAQISQQLLLNNNSQNNDNLMNSFLAAAANASNQQASGNNLATSTTTNLMNTSLAPSPSPKSTSINTSSSLDKLTSIVDSIDKINANNQIKNSTSSSNGLNLSGNNSTPGLSDSDNGSNLLLQLPTLSSLNKQSKTSPNLYGGSSTANQQQAAFQDVFNNINNMKLLPHQLLELHQQQQSSSLFQPTPIKSPSTSSTHSSHSSSPSPNFFAKLTQSNTVNSNPLSSLASQLGLTGLSQLNQLPINKQSILNSGNTNKKSSSSTVSANLNKLSNSQQNKLNQQQQLNNLLRQQAAIQLLQQQQTEEENMFDEIDKDEDDEDEDAFDLNAQILKQIKKQMQKSKQQIDNTDPLAAVLNTSPLDLSCNNKQKDAQSALNALIASKLLESGNLAGLSQFNQLNNLSNLNQLSQLNQLTGLSSLFQNNLTNNLGINNFAQLNQLNSILSANNLLNNNSNKSFGRLDLLSSLLGASNQQQNLAAAAINPLLGLNLNQQLQQQQTSLNKKKESSSSSFNKQQLNNSNNSSLNNQLVNPNSSSNFWNLSSTAKIKPYSASSSLHTPNPKAMQLRERSSSGQGRANPWQTQWMNRSSEQNRDVFTCVYCRMTFNSLDEMTQHMKISPKCGMAGMQQANAVSAASSHNSNSTNNSSSTPNNSSSTTDRSSSLNSSSTASNQHSSSSNKNKLSSSSSNLTSNPLLLNKEKDKSGNQVPRKLVRGQDVWLGRGAEQTRQILKCIWCQESFKTLDDLSNHMQVTKHFMNIVSPEQITSWKQPDDKTQQSQMDQVLSCKVCNESFPSLKELSTHMQKTSHYKDNNLLSINKSDLKDRQSPSGLSTSSTSTTGTSIQLNSSNNQLNGSNQKKRNSNNGSSNNSQSNSSKEKRKKSLPVRKLLELERTNGQTIDSNTSGNSISKTLLEGMNRLLFSAGVSNDKSLKNGNLDTLSQHSNESDCSLNTSNNISNLNESTANKQSITCEECKENCDDLNQFIMHLKNCKSSGQNTQLLNLIVAAAQQQQQDEQSNQNLEDDDEDKLMVNDTLENEDMDDKLNGSKDKIKTPERTESRQSTSSSIDNSNENNSKCTTPQLNGQSPTKTSLTKEKNSKKSGSALSGLSALEQLIEKSFDSKSKKSTNNQGILQRLGIDEEVCTPWVTNSPTTTTTNTTNTAFFPWSP